MDMPDESSSEVLDEMEYDSYGIVGFVPMGENRLTIQFFPVEYNPDIDDLKILRNSFNGGLIILAERDEDILDTIEQIKVIVDESVQSVKNNADKDKTGNAVQVIISKRLWNEGYMQKSKILNISETSEG